MLDYLLVDTGSRLHLLFISIDINGMENFGLISIRDSVCNLMLSGIAQWVIGLAGCSPVFLLLRDSLACSM